MTSCGHSTRLAAWSKQKRPASSEDLRGRADQLGALVGYCKPILHPISRGNSPPMLTTPLADVAVKPLCGTPCFATTYTLRQSSPVRFVNSSTTLPTGSPNSRLSQRRPAHAGLAQLSVVEHSLCPRERGGRPYPTLGGPLVTYGGLTIPQLLWRSRRYYLQANTESETVLFEMYRNFMATGHERPW